ncbi:Pentatricopeptide repeat-containing protein [Vitis vinifera]|uniref:Pentatricopeptide repeat-containing protein n=1 Tax=Vitis vinifera TaxID=29760 RepID=A0A438F3W3_VITVI|nr:Pentatricopeptide repeat-containing protein [Vitis vinifera]
MYSSCGNLGYARQVFDEILQPDLPSWNSIINANFQAGLVDMARNLFAVMPERNVISWSCMINGLWTLGGAGTWKWAHAYIDNVDAG